MISPKVLFVQLKGVCGENQAIKNKINFWDT